MNSGAGQESLETWRKRLRYRAWHRGTREMDLILGGYCDAHASTWDEAALTRFELLMEESDVDLLGWVTGQLTPGPEQDADLIGKISKFQRDQTKQ